MIKYSSLVLAALLTFSGCGGSSDNGTTDTAKKTSNSGLIINEVLADNTKNADPDLGLFGDWIELKNSGKTNLDISNYGLSDSTKSIKWHFPTGTNINAGDFLIVWADDFNTTANPNPTALHTSFKLKSNKEKVLLYDASDKLLDSLDLKEHKVSQSDTSIARNESGKFILSTSPTLGQENTSNAFTLSKTPHFSVKEGVYSTAFDISITAENGAIIHYTTDGTDATVDSPVYNNPIHISDNKTTLKAIAKEPGADKLISKDKSKTFVIAPAHSVVINEIFADGNKSLTDQYKKSDWVELYNTSGSDVNLNNYILSDSKKLSKSKWKFTQTIPANGYLVIFADKSNDATHSDFKLSSKGDSAVLYNSNGKIIDFKDFKKLKGVSLSRQGDNNFTETVPSPNTVNNK